MPNSSFWTIDRTLSGATSPELSGLGGDDNEEVHLIPQISSITGTSSSDCLVSYLGHSLDESYPPAEVQSVYSAAPAYWARLWHWITQQVLTNDKTNQPSHQPFFATLELI